MLKQKKNLNLYLKYNTVKMLRKRKIFVKYKHSILNLSINKLKFNKSNFVLSIRLTQNNVFCTLYNTFENKTKLISSAGIAKLKISKKMLKYNSKFVLLTFLEKAMLIIKNSNLCINLLCPKYLKRRILFQIKQILRNNIIILNVINNKAFNGCKQKKKKRKKQRGLRIFK